MNTIAYRITKIDDNKYQFYVDCAEFNMYNDGFNFKDVVIMKVKYIYNRFHSLVYNLNTNEIYWDWLICKDLTKTNDPVIAKSKYTNKAIVKLKNGYWVENCYEDQDERDAITELIETNVEGILETIEEIRAEVLLD